MGGGDEGAVGMGEGVAGGFGGAEVGLVVGFGGGFGAQGGAFAGGGHDCGAVVVLREGGGGVKIFFSVRRLGIIWRFGGAGAVKSRPLKSRREAYSHLVL